MGIFLVLALFNAVGAVGLSIAGLGTIETGLAGALVFPRLDLGQAATIALSARPTLLIANLGAAFSLSVLSSALLRNSRER